MDNQRVPGVSGELGRYVVSQVVESEVGRDASRHLQRSPCLIEMAIGFPGLAVWKDIFALVVDV